MASDTAIRNRFEITNRFHGSSTLPPTLEHSSVLGLMTKYWETGRVKTRLGQSIGMGTAASLHRLFVSYLCTRLTEVAQHRELCVSPHSAFAAVQADLDTWNQAGNWTLTDQGDGDLGQRMERWFSRTRTESGCSILIGGDCPTLTAGDLREAMEALSSNDLVLGPAVDGGYYLIGLSGPWRPEFADLFHSMPWSTDHVYTITKQRSKRHGITLAELVPREDVDTIEELTNLRRSIRTSDQFRELKMGIDGIMRDDDGKGELEE